MVTFLSVASSIYQNISLKKVGRALSGLRAEEITDLVAGTSSRSYKALTEANKELVIPQIMDAMRNVWLFFLVAAALSFMLSPLLWVSNSYTTFPPVGTQANQGVARSEDKVERGCCPAAGEAV